MKLPSGDVLKLYDPYMSSILCPDGSQTNVKIGGTLVIEPDEFRYMRKPPKLLTASEGFTKMDEALAAARPAPVFDKAALDKAFEEIERNSRIWRPFGWEDVYATARALRSQIPIDPELPPRPNTTIGGFRDHLAVWWLTKVKRLNTHEYGATIEIDTERHLLRAGIAAVRAGFLGHFHGSDFIISNLAFDPPPPRGWLRRKWDNFAEAVRWDVIQPVKSAVEEIIDNVFTRRITRAAWRRLHRHGDLILTKGKASWFVGKGSR